MRACGRVSVSLRFYRQGAGEIGGFPRIISGWDSDFSSSENFLESQMARLPSVGQAVFSGIVQVSQFPDALEPDLWGGLLRPQHTIRVRICGHEATDCEDSLGLEQVGIKISPALNPFGSPKWDGFPLCGRLTPLLFLKCTQFLWLWNQQSVNGPLRTNLGLSSGTRS